ncbi:hypothetical protein [Streptomyces sp. TRM68367]|uniref:hypothetical protein n=1 Tax=Streptomyces sp. TRM68367 TaxID=2758415 RepID=UPI00165B6C8C|nr:hypothetical protein [Streptomyces sp. TRM68367]MBC9729274.1 hypothetical protein [Streptomyces sp. TRM68367]
MNEDELSSPAGHTIEGILAVLHTPMRSKRIVFGTPSPLPLLADSPVLLHGQRVGRVTSLRLRGQHVHWTGRLDQQQIQWADEPADPIKVPFPEPSAAELIAAGRLVGVPDIVQGAMNTRGTQTTLSDWAVASVTLLRAEASPWPELTLRLSNEQETSRER